MKEVNKGKFLEPRFVEEVNLDDENLRKAPYILTDGGKIYKGKR